LPEDTANVARGSLIRWIKFIVLGVVASLIVWLLVRHYAGVAAHERAAAVVGELGGQCGSISVEPFGTEVRISFKKKSLTPRAALPTDDPQFASEPI
jgi:hypothetical protein